jgi:hypothetical protein
MRWAGVDEATIDAIESQSASRIHALSGGVPRAVHRVAAALLEQKDRPPARSRPETSDSWQVAEWMGQPIEEEEG